MNEIVNEKQNKEKVFSLANINAYSTTVREENEIERKTNKKISDKHDHSGRWLQRKVKPRRNRKFHFHLVLAVSLVYERTHGLFFFFFF